MTRPLARTPAIKQGSLYLKHDRGNTTEPDQVGAHWGSTRGTPRAGRPRESNVRSTVEGLVAFRHTRDRRGNLASGCGPCR